MNKEEEIDSRRLRSIASDIAHSYGGTPTKEEIRICEYGIIRFYTEYILKVEYPQPSNGLSKDKKEVGVLENKEGKVLEKNEGSK